MTDLLPNTAILKSPSNWFLVGFAVVILCFVANILGNRNG